MPVKKRRRSSKSRVVGSSQKISPLTQRHSSIDFDPTDPRQPLAPHDVIQLQRTVGNQAVQRLLANRIISQQAPSPDVQRGLFGDVIGDIASGDLAGAFEHIWNAIENVAKKLNKKQKKSKSKIKTAKIEVLDADEKKERIEEVINQARWTEEEQKALDTDGWSKLQKELKTKQNELKAKKKEIEAQAKSLEKLENAPTELEELEGKLKKEEAKKKSSNRKINKYKKQIDEYKELTATRDEELPKLRATVKDLKDTIAKIDGRIAFIKEIKRKKKWEAAMGAMETDLKSVNQAGEKEGEEGDPHTLESWFADFVPDASFLGRPVQKSDKSAYAGIHKELHDRLKIVEAHLQTLPEYAGKSLKDIGDEMGIYRISGLRQPKTATGGTRVSLHSYGLAVDINAATNPYVRGTTAGVVKRATLLLSGAEFDLATKIKGDVSKKWQQLNEASIDLVNYFKLADDDAKLEGAVKALQTKTGDSRTVDDWKTQIDEDYKALKGKGDWKSHGGKRDPKKGFMDLPQVLVETLVKVGKLDWGGNYGSSGKDIQHFDYRSGTIKRR